MGNRLLIATGWVWPFAVALLAVVGIAAGCPLRSDGAVMLLFVAALLGSPAVVVTIARWLPPEWPAGSREMAAALLAVPVVGLELLLAVCLLVWGANVAAPGWIE